MNKIFQFILQRPVLVMACIVAIFFAAASGLKNFKLDASSDALVIEGDEAFKVYRETGEIFGNSDFLIIVFTPNSDVFSPDSLSTIKNLDNQLEKLPGVQSVLTILDAPIFFQPKVPLADLMDNLKTLESEDIDLVAAKEEIISNPVYSELIISPSGDTTAMQVTLKENPLYRRLITDRYELLGLNGMSNSQKKELNNINQQISQINDDEAKERADLIAQIRELLLQNSDKGTLFLGGASMIATDMMGFIKSDLTIFGAGVAIVFCLMLYLFFQNIWFVLLPLGNALITTAFTASVLGLMAVSYTHLTLPTKA